MKDYGREFVNYLKAIFSGSAVGFSITGGDTPATLTVTGDATISGTPATGGISTIASGSLPAAAVLDIISIPATYAYLVLQITGASSDTADRILYVRASIDNGENFDATAGNYPSTYIKNATITNPGVASMIYRSAAGAAETTDVTLVLTGYQAGPHTKFSSRIQDGTIEMLGTYLSVSAINALRILWDDTGSFDAGTYALYGVN